MQRQPKWRALAGIVSIAATGSLLPQNALSLQFEAGPVEISLSTKLSVGASMRADDPNPKLLSGGNVTGASASSTVTDDGDLNYGKGDWFSIIFQGTNDLSINYDNIGAFGRIRYWYDHALADRNVRHGNVQRYEKNAPLDDSEFGDLSKAANLVLLDAYVYGSFDIANMPLDVRLGRQVVSWGESTFIQNSVNIINPIDVNALRSPGAELKDALLPVGLLYASLGITNNLSVEAFYQYEWEKVQLPGCGTFFSTIEPAPEGCDKLVTYSSDQQLSDAELVALGPKKADGFSLTGQREFVGGYVPRGADLEPDNGGQYGIAMRYYAEELNATEFGFYYVNYHERLPIFSVVKGPNPQYFFEFPEDTEVFAVTFATNVDSWSFSGELSHRPNMPLQINTTELTQPLVKPDSVWSTMRDEIVNADDGTIIHGYDEFGVTQLQFTFINFFDRILGASRLTILGEVGFDWVDGLPSQSERRYGRSPVFGMGGVGSFDPFAGDNPQLSIDVSNFESLLQIQNAIRRIIPDYNLVDRAKEYIDENIEVRGSFACSSVTVRAKDKTLPIGPVLVEKGEPNLNSEYCTNDGYTTQFSWGVRLAAALDYNNVFNGVNLRPVVTYFRDMKGYGPTPNFNEGSVVIGYSLSAEYLNKYSARIAFTDYKAGKYNPERDRDFLSLSVGVSF